MLVKKSIVTVGAASLLELRNDNRSRSQYRQRFTGSLLAPHVITRELDPCRDSDSWPSKQAWGLREVLTLSVTEAKSKEENCFVISENCMDSDLCAYENSAGVQPSSLV